MNGILFKPWKIKAIAEDDREWQTRRVIKPQPCDDTTFIYADGYCSLQAKNGYAPYAKSRYQVGEVVYIKEKALYWVSPILEGVEYGSDWEMAKFDELMTSRFATAKPTILITNKELTELPERIQSRFKDKVMARAIHNSASDYRQRR